MPQKSSIKQSFCLSLSHFYLFHSIVFRSWNNSLSLSFFSVLVILIPSLSSHLSSLLHLLFVTEIILYPYSLLLYSYLSSSPYLLFFCEMILKLIIILSFLPPIYLHSPISLLSSLFLLLYSLSFLLFIFIPPSPLVSYLLSILIPISLLPPLFLFISSSSSIRKRGWWPLTPRLGASTPSLVSLCLCFITGSLPLPLLGYLFPFLFVCLRSIYLISAVVIFLFYYLYFSVYWLLIYLFTVKCLSIYGFISIYLFLCLYLYFFSLSLIFYFSRSIIRLFFLI